MRKDRQRAQEEKPARRQRQGRSQGRDRAGSKMWSDSGGYSGEGRRNKARQHGSPFLLSPRSLQPLPRFPDCPGSGRIDENVLWERTAVALNLDPQTSQSQIGLHDLQQVERSLTFPFKGSWGQGA